MKDRGKRSELRSQIKMHRATENKMCEVPPSEARRIVKTPSACVGIPEGDTATRDEWEGERGGASAASVRMRGRKHTERHGAP